MIISPTTPVANALDDPAARAVLERLAPDSMAMPFLDDMRGMPLSALVDPPTALVEAGVIGVADPEARVRLWRELEAVRDLSSADTAGGEVVPDSGYEDSSVAIGSANLAAESSCARWDVFEIRLDGPTHGNPFVDVELAARFVSANGDADALEAGGFYDGDGRYLIRFMPPTEGPWTFTTESNARSLDGIQGTFKVTPAAPGVHGPVRVADQHHFAYADGTRFIPVGTTAYAWTHQTAELEERTLRTLEEAPFNKLRMCVMPKSFMFNENEPPRNPFPGSTADGWDTTRFVPEFFQHLDDRVRRLGELGIEVDLILLHPYDRWGFSNLGAAADRRYFSYVVRRLAAYRNIWWSLANEYELLQKSFDDWDDLAQVISDNDPAHHLVSIHNWFTSYDHSRPWITHCSLQTNPSKLPEETAVLRRRWGKPVIIDECGYEGDLDQGWGNLTAQEFVHRCWESAIRGGYVAHGETYLNDREEIFWSKGGELVGESPARLEFLANMLRESPTGVVDPIQFGPFNWDVPYAGVPEQYYLAYLGPSQPRYRDVRLPAGQSYAVDVVDTWNMTTDRLPGLYSGRFRVQLPARSYMALRMIRADQ